MNRLLITITLAGSLPFAAMPAYSGDAKAGRELAKIWCAQCHVVEAGQRQASDIGPPFAQIANDPTKTSLSIATWLTDPHPPMPKLSLTQTQINDLVTYIRAMKTD